MVSLSGIKDTVISMLTAANTSTATNDISSGLSRRVAVIKTGNPKYNSIPNTQYPAICVDIAQAINKPCTLGGAGSYDRMQHDLDIIVYCLTCEGNGEQSKDQCLKLTDNVGHFFRNNQTLSGTVNFSSSQTIKFNEKQQNQQYWQATSTIIIKAKKFGD